MTSPGIELPSRVLVVGPYPPWAGPGTAATLATTEELLRTGREVQVLSDRPSAAHDSADLRGVVGAIALARRSRSHDAVLVHLEPDLFGPPDVGRARRALARASLAAALRRWEVAVVVVDLSRYFSDVAALPSRMVWQAATELWVASEHDRTRLEQAGVPRERLVVRQAGRTTGSRREQSPWVLSGAVARDAVLAEVRTRAAARAAAESVGPVPAPPAWPQHPAPVRSRGAVAAPSSPARLGLRDYASLAKRAAAKGVRMARSR